MFIIDEISLLELEMILSSMLGTFVFNYKSYLFYCVLGKNTSRGYPHNSDIIAYDNSGIKVCSGNKFIIK